MAVTPVNIGTTAGGETLCGVDPYRVGLTIYNSHATSTLYIARSGTTVSATVAEVAVAPGGSVVIDRESGCRLGWKALSSSGTIAACYTPTYPTDTGVS